MRASIRQVAEQAGVSRMTVTNVLRDRTARVSEQTRLRVLEAVRELDYVPVAGPTTQGRRLSTYVIGVVYDILGLTRSDLGVSTFEGIMGAAEEHGYDLLTMLRPQPAWMKGRADLRFLDRRADGYVFINDRIGGRESVLEALVQNRVPAVVCYRGEAPDGVVTIDIGNADAVRSIMDHLAFRGHRRIAHLFGDLGTGPGRDRLNLFHANVERLGLSPAECPAAGGHWELRPEEGKKILASGATAVFCVNDHLAIQLWRMAEESGRRIPEDLSIVGIDNEAEGSKLGLTTVDISPAAIGRAAVDAVIGLLRGDTAAACSRVTPVQLIERTSVRSLK